MGWSIISAVTRVSKQDPCLCRDCDSCDYPAAHCADGCADEEFIFSGCIGIGCLAGVIWYVPHMAVFAKRVEEVLLSGPCSVPHRNHDRRICLFWASVN